VGYCEVGVFSCVLVWAIVGIKVGTDVSVTVAEGSGVTDGVGLAAWRVSSMAVFAMILAVAITSSLEILLQADNNRMVHVIRYVYGFILVISPFPAVHYTTLMPVYEMSLETIYHCHRVK